MTSSTQPTFSYAAAIREAVRIRSSVSSQDDGALDMIYVDIIRPAETAGELKVPAIMLPSGYFAAAGRTRQSETKPPPGRPIDFFPHFYDNYFVARGYAVALVDVTGTRGSTGCPDIIGPGEVEGLAAVVEWLAGKGHAVDLGGNEVDATWSTGRTGVIGKSWDGTIPNRMATLDVTGLATIVPIAAVSELHEDFWYNGARYGGTPMAYSDPHRSTPEELVTQVRDLFRAEQDDPDPQTDFWEGRSALRRAGDVRTSVFIVHGRNDYNVTPNQYARWWAALGEHDVPRKLWLSLAAHEDPFDFRRDEWLRTLHRWFDHWLHGVENGIMDEPPVDVEHQPGQWATHDAWPDPRAAAVTMQPVATGSARDTAAGRLRVHTPGSAVQPMSFRAGYTGIDQMARDPHSSLPHRLVFVTDELSEPIRLSGWTHIDLTIRSAEDVTLTAMLVDYGRDTYIHWEVGGGIRDLETVTPIGQGSDGDGGVYRDVALRTHVTDFQVVTRGWANAGFLLGDAIDAPDGGPHELSFELEPDDHVFRAGHRIGLVIGGADADMLWKVDQDVRVQVDVAATRIHVPFVGGTQALRSALGE